MAYIRIRTGPNKGKQFEIKDAPLTIGREDNQIIQILDQGVSRSHAEIFHLGEMCFVRDLGSTNGTFVNDVKVTEESLKAGDELLIGTTILAFVDDAPGKAGGSGGDVEFEEGQGKFETTTVELKVDPPVTKQHERVIGKEIQSRNLTLISQVGRILRGEPDLQRALERTLEILCAAISANQCYFFVVDPPTGKLIPRAVLESEDSGAEKKVSRTIVNRVRESFMPLLTTDAALDGRFSLSESIILKKIKSVICAPVLVEDKVEGLLYFHSSKVDRTLMVEDLELVAAVGLQLSMLLAASGSVDRVRKGLMGTVRSLVTAMEMKDPGSRGHAHRVSEYAAVVGAQLALPPEEVHRVRLAALLHDVGKLAVRLDHSTATSDQIREQHVQAGERMLTGIEGFEQILPGIRYHHERADGTGFPYKLKNADIPVMARIVIVANAFDEACTRGGPGGAPIPSKEVVKDLAQRGGKDFDDDVIKALILCHRNGSLHGAVPGEPV
ncbi:MAG TPA: HD domain-containing phosphohydrolase [Planctomycetota bacterium]|nr:HD domain-containing phosphohydrolase [Planctomycetota bacterium]